MLLRFESGLPHKVKSRPSQCLSGAHRWIRWIHPLILSHPAPRKAPYAQSSASQRPTRCCWFPGTGDHWRSLQEWVSTNLAKKPQRTSKKPVLTSCILSHTLDSLDPAEFPVDHTCGFRRVAWPDSSLTVVSGWSGAGLAGYSWLYSHRSQPRHTEFNSTCDCAKVSKTMTLGYGWKTLQQRVIFKVQPPIFTVCCDIVCYSLEPFPHHSPLPCSEIEVHRAISLS